MKRRLPWLAAALLAATPLLSETLAEADGLVIAGGSARTASPVARSGAGYLTITNGGSAADRLLWAESDAAERVELHLTEVEGGIARMIAVEEAITIPAGGTVTLEQGGTHLMFMGLTEGWNPEAGVPVTLVFESAGPVEVVLPVAVGAAEAGQPH